MRRLWALIYWLPPDAAYHRSLADTQEPEHPAQGVSLMEFAQQHSANLA